MKAKRRADKKRLKEYYEDEAKRLSHQELMYQSKNKHDQWWHRKRLFHVISSLSEAFKADSIGIFADVGCAEGFYVNHVALSRKETLCIGLDIARTYISKAKANRETPNTDYIVCDVEKLPLQQGSVDLVLCSEVLEHVCDYQSSLNELCRIGRKHLVISFPGHTYLYSIISKAKCMKKLADRLVPYVGHISELRVSEVKKILEKEADFMQLKIGCALPLMIFKLVFSIKLVDLIDNVLCRILTRLNGVEYANIHVMRIILK